MHKQADRVLLNQEIKDTLRKHHYELGNDNEPYITNNSQYNAVGQRTSLDPTVMKVHFCDCLPPH